jgi:hypothetical protein
MRLQIVFILRYEATPDDLPRVHVANIYTLQFSANLSEPRIVQYRRWFVRHWYLWCRKL